VAIGFSAMSLLNKMILFCVITISGFYFYFWTLLRLKHSIVSCKIKENQCEVMTKKGEKFFATLSGNSFISALLIILNFKINGKVFGRTLMICRDSLNQDEFIELKRCLLLNDVN